MQGTSLITFSKQALFTPVFCWVLGAGLARYRLKPVNFICVSAIVFVLYFFGTPYVGVGKGVDKVNLRDAVSLSFNLLQNMSTVREEYKQAVSTEYLKINYYNQGEGVLDRLQMLSIDALLIQTADDEGYFGFEPTKEGWENVVPHLIWKDKPTPFFGNYYAHRLGLVADDDVSTGVSFGVTADSYFEGGFFGVLVIQTLCFLAIFTIFSFVIGSVREHPAVILLVVMTAHVAPEGQIPGAIGLVLFCLVIIGFAFFCRYVFPLVADTFVREPSIPQPIAASAFAAAD